MCSTPDRSASPGCGRPRWCRFRPIPLVGGVVLSLGANILAFLGVFADAAGDAAGAHAGARLSSATSAGGKPQAFRLWRASATVGDLEATLARYLGAQRARRAFDAFFAERGERPSASEEADALLIRHAEHLLSPAIGASTSHLVLSLLLRRRAMSGKSALKLLDDASAAIQSSRDQLQHALDHARQGITVFDSNLGADDLEPRIRRIVRSAPRDAAPRRRARRDRALQRRARRSTDRARPTTSSPSASRACSMTTSRCACGCIPRSA